MPNWKIHLEVGKRLNKYLNYKNDEYQEFLLGNLLPDINNAYIVKDIKIRVGHSITHFDKGKDFRHHLAFFNKYQNKILEPMYLGYYIHLYTDYIFNKNFYEMVEQRKLDYIEKEQLRLLKQHDFKVLDNKYINNNLEINNVSLMTKRITIHEVDLCENDLENVINYLNNTPFYKGNYKIYTEKELDDLLDETIDVIYNNIKVLFNNREKSI